MTESRHAPHFQVAGVGAGPANLSLSALYQGITPGAVALFEAKPGPAWHDGLMFPGVQMQTMWLKDLVSLVDPGNPLSFVSYLVRTGRVFSFLNAQYTDIPRLEFANYLAWAAAQLRHVYYGRPIDRISFEKGAFLLYSGEELAGSGDHLVLGVGSRPRMPAGLAGLNGGRVVPADELLARLGDLTPPVTDPVAVVGGGQTGAECVLELRRLGFREIRWFGKRSWFAPLDDSPSANEMFRPAYTRFFRALPEDSRRRLAGEQVLTSDGVAQGTLRTIFQENYRDLLRTGRPGVTMLPGRRVTGARCHGDGVRLVCEGAAGQESHDVRLVVVAAGRRPAPLPLDPQLSSMIETDADGQPCVDADCGLRWKFGDTNKIFVQNRARYSLGLQDANLSLLSVRSALIINSIMGGPVFEINDQHCATCWG